MTTRLSSASARETSRSKRQRQLDEHRIERSFYRTCRGVQISASKIGAVFRAGQVAINQGADDAALDKAIVEFVSTIREN